MWDEVWGEVWDEMWDGVGRKGFSSKNDRRKGTKKDRREVEGEEKINCL